MHDSRRQILLLVVWGCGFLALGCSDQHPNPQKAHHAVLEFLPKIVAERIENRSQETNQNSKQIRTLENQIAKKMFAGKNCSIALMKKMKNGQVTETRDSIEKNYK